MREDDEESVRGDECDHVRVEDAVLAELAGQHGAGHREDAVQHHHQGEHPKWTGGRGLAERGGQRRCECEHRARDSQIAEQRNCGDRRADRVKIGVATRDNRQHTEFAHARDDGVDRDRDGEHAELLRRHESHDDNRYRNIRESQQ